MKSIKEKAHEHSLEPRENAHCGYDEEDLENSFEAGANYVLECFESILPFVAKKGIIYGKIKETIKQLKK